MKELHAAGYSLLSIDATGQTALHVAARYGNKEVVKYLIACAPTSILNMRDNERGQTALHKAAAHKRRAICCMLVAGGASLMRQDHAGLTPRHLALRAEDHDLAAYLESETLFASCFAFVFNRLFHFKAANRMNRLVLMPGCRDS